MKKYLLLLLIYNNIHSQNVIVIDSLTKEPIPFVTIRLNKNNGTYTNEYGKFELNKKSSDTIYLTHITYSDFNIKANEVKDTILLSPNAILLKEIKIIKGRQIAKYIDFPRKSNSFSSWPISSKSELITLVIPNSENSNSIIKNLTFGFRKKRESNINQTNLTAIRINIYSCENQKNIGKNLFSSSVIYINPNKKDNFELNLDKEFLSFDEKGIFIGLEIIGDIDGFGKIIKENAYVHVLLTDNIVNDFICKTYVKYTFDKESKLKAINDIIEKTSGKIIDRNLSFGLTIVK